MHFHFWSISQALGLIWNIKFYFYLSIRNIVCHKFCHFSYSHMRLFIYNIISFTDFPRIS